MRKQTKRDLLELVHLIPHEQNDVLNELIELQTILEGLKGVVRRNPHDAAGINDYEYLCNRYGELIKQIKTIVPANADRKIHDAVKAFVADGWKHGICDELYQRV